MMQAWVGAAQQRAIAYLDRRQQPDGGFTSESSPTRAPWQPTYTYNTTFVPSLILASLADVPETDTIRKKLAAFLLEQRSPQWSFNYWSRQSPEATSHPYPDDLDDTFCALIGLYLHDPTLITPAALASVVKLLVATESSVGGPYRTWLVPPEGNADWQDTDLAVNANVAYFISLISNPLPNLQTMFASAIAGQDFQSPYYPSAYPIWYYLARSVSSQHRDSLADIVGKEATKNTKRTPLETALLATSLLRLRPQHPSISKLMASLQKTQLADGSWPADAFCIDPSRHKKQHFNGSVSLTTAFALEALGIYQATHSVVSVNPPTHDTVEQLQQTIITAARQQIQSLPQHVRQPFKHMLRALVNGDSSHEITLLPYYFAQSLNNAGSVLANEQFLVQLGLANLYGWVAYTIYDDFLDDEGQPLRLSAANAAMRRSLVSFQKALPQPDFYNYVLQTFDCIDNANTWEVAHCRFPVSQDAITMQTLPAYGRRQKLAERSLGHALTPLAVLVQSGHSLQSPAIQTFEKAFRHYLIARQLNDDAHDWKEDLLRGHITYVVATLLKEAGVVPGDHRFVELLPQLERQFWHHTLLSICKTMEQHVKQGQKLISKSSVMKPGNILERLFTGLEASISETRTKQAESLDFLQQYSGDQTKS